MSGSVDSPIDSPIDRSSEPNVELADEYQPPKANGEVVFTAPWQSRVFAMAVALTEADVFTWPSFQAQLIEVISAADSAERSSDHSPDQEYPYFEYFQQALLNVLEQSAVLDADQHEKLVAELAVRPHGHDHSH